MRRIAITLVLTILVGLALPFSTVYATGVTPARVESEVLKPGNTFSKEVYISNPETGRDRNYEFRPDLGEFNSWVEFSPGTTFTIPAGQSRIKTTITFRVPSNAELKMYTGTIRVVSISDAGQQQAGGVTVAESLAIPVKLSLTDLDFESLLVRSINIGNVGLNTNLNLELKIENQGNVDSAPTNVDIEIQNLAQNTLANLKNSVIPQVTAGSTETVTVPFAHELGLGEYFANVKVYKGAEVLREERVVFRVVTEVDGGETQTPAEEAESRRTVIIALIVVGGILLLTLLVLALQKREQNKKKSSTVEKKL